MYDTKITANILFIHCEYDKFGASVASVIRLRKPIAPTALHSDYAPGRSNTPTTTTTSIHPSIRVVNFIADGTQKDKQRFIDLLHAKMDQEWEARKAVSHRSVYYYKADVSAH